MITIQITVEQVKLLEDSLARFAVTYPDKNEICAETYAIIINARQEAHVKKK